MTFRILFFLNRVAAVRINHPQRLGLGLHGGWDKFDASIDAIFADDQTDVAENEIPTEGYTLLNASLS